MKLFKTFITLLIVCFMMCITVYADNDFYYVYDSESSFKESFDNYNSALNFYNEHLDEYKNLVLSKNDEVIKMEYGVVSFNSEACSVDTKYYSLNRKEYDYINGCYGNDGLFIEENDDGYIFYLSGDKGRVNKDDVRLIPYSKDITVSSFGVKDNYLFHNIKSQMDNNYYSYSLKLDNISFLSSNRTYYSYDTHYFYDDFYTMSDDYREGIRDNAINEEAYYNYYQYLSYRSLSLYQVSDFERYLKEYLGFTGRLNSYNDLNNDGANDVINRSELYDIAPAVFANETINGTNALMLMSAIINESAYGKSLNSYYYNNLFYTASYNHDYLRNSKHFDTVSDSVNNYAHYTINRYLSNSISGDYRGLFFGNKNSGLTVNYANDPYYGERNASVAFEMDEALGFNDRNAYSLVCVNKGSYIYEDEYLSNKLSRIEHDEAVYTVLDKNDDYIVILKDNAGDDYHYQFEKSIAYIDPEDVNFIINNLEEYKGLSFKEVSFDFDGGLFEDLNELTVGIRNIYTADSIIPLKSGYIFKGYKKEYDGEKDRWNYTAEYKKISSVSLNDSIDKKMSINEYLDLNDSGMLVAYEDGSGEFIRLNTDHIYFYDNTETGDITVNISYGGIVNDVTVNINDNDERLKENITAYLSDKRYTDIKKALSNNNLNLSWTDLREADYGLYRHNHRNYVMSVYDPDIDISLSGLDLSLQDRKTFSLIQDIYYIDVADISESARNSINKVAKSYGLKDEKGLNISFRFNYENIKMNTPVIVSVLMNDMDDSRIYTVYHENSDGDIIKCKSVHYDNSIVFEAFEEGDYLILSKDSFNIYKHEDVSETVTKELTGIDEHKVNMEFLLIMAIIIANFIGMVIYFIMNSRKEEKWRDYRKLLQMQGSAQEEKPKN